MGKKEQAFARLSWVSIFLLCISISLWPGLVDSAVAVTSQDRAALIALYNSTNGDNWLNNSGWKDAPLDADGFAMPGTECSWYGVTCDSDGTVIEIRLSDNYLSGSIPPELGDLANLTYLNMAGSLEGPHLSGAIPQTLGNLTHLTHLILPTQQLTGSIPAELGNLVNLTSLNLETNLLSGNIPSELGSLANLISLRLGNNHLDGSIPPELGNLVNLIELILSSNRLNGPIPLELGNLSSLMTLALGNNQLSGIIPVQLGNLTNLTKLGLGTNQLSGGIPVALGNLTSLTYLDLSENNLNGLIPPELGNLTGLKTLFLYSNQLSGSLPPELGNLVNLTWFHLHCNQLTGEIPSSITNLNLLVNLDIRYNGLYSTNQTVRDFLTSMDTGWETTQTIAPSNISVGSVTDSSITLDWTPIDYTGNTTGGYRVYYSTVQGGPYTLFDVTANKTIAQMNVTGLASGATFYFVIQTWTDPTWTDPYTFNQNTVESEYSVEVSATTININCGNGVLDTGEECDDGNTTNGDGCSAVCVIEYCGDGTVNNVNEECDDGNQQDGDGCSATCLIEDLCPADPNKTQPGICGCGEADVDTDSDGILDCQDNCPFTVNPDQADTDGNGVGDACSGRFACGTLIQLTTDPTNDMEPQWSPDGTEIVFRSNRAGSRDIWVMNQDGSNPLQLTSDGNADRAPVWSPDGTRIAFHSGIPVIPPSLSNNDIWVIDADGSNSVQLTSDAGDIDDSYAAWSPDGTQIAFVSDRSGNSDIWVMNADGSTPVQLTFDPNSDSDPDWSPDGTKIAFSSERAGNQDIWVMNADGTSPVQLTFDQDSDNSPDWSPDGTELVFISKRSGNWDVWTYQFGFDSDGDGTNDGCDFCPADPDKTEPGVCGCGIPEDADGDGTIDCLGAYTLLQLTDNSYNDGFYPPSSGFIMNSNNQAVWFGSDGNDNEIFFYDGTMVKQLTDNVSEDTRPTITQNGDILWSSIPEGETDYEIMMNSGAGPIRLTNDSFDDIRVRMNVMGQMLWEQRDPSGGATLMYYDGVATQPLASTASPPVHGPAFQQQLNDSGQVVWSASNGTDDEIYLFENGSSRVISVNTYDDSDPSLDRTGSVAWSGWDGTDYEIFLYNGTGVTQLTSNDYDDLSPDVEGNYVVWSGWDGTDYEIFLYNGISTIQLTDNAYDDTAPQVNANGYVTWQSRDGNDYEIFVYDGTRVIQLSDNTIDNRLPGINANGYIMWMGYDGNDDEIFLARPAEPVPNGGDANGDGFVDSQQSNVASLQSIVTGDYIAVDTTAVGSGAQIANVSVNSEAFYGDDPDYDMPYGVVKFDVVGLAAGASETVRVYYYGVSDLSGYEYRKFDAVTGTWYTLPGVVFGSETINGQTVAYADLTLTDGGIGDADSTANGTIKDPGGPALPSGPVCSADPALLGSQTYATVMAAYDAVAGSGIIDLQGMVIGESLIFNQNVTVTLRGGYDCYFNEPPTGTTILSSSGTTMTINGGTVIADGLVLR